MEYPLLFQVYCHTRFVANYPCIKFLLTAPLTRILPHTAAGLSKAATNAVALANSSNVNVVEALKRWEPSQIELGNNLKYLGISLGNRSQFNQI
jgi:hypothetical protein